MTTKIWSLFQYPPKLELAAAASLPLLLLTVALLRAEHVILGRRGYSVLGGKQGNPRLVQLGRGRWLALGLVFAVLLCPVFLPYGALFNAAFSRVASQFITFSNFTLHNVEFVFFELSSTQARGQEHLPARHAVGHHRHRHGAGDRLSHGPQGRHRPSRARLPRHRAGRDPRHRARGRAVPELHQAAVRALRHHLDPADRLRDHRAAGGLSAAAVGVPLGACGPRGRRPHPRRQPAAHAVGHHRAAACAPA